MLTTIPSNFVEVSREAFEDYLTWCNDYTRTAYAGAIAYQFKGGHRFAYVQEERGKPDRVFVDPTILVKRTLDSPLSQVHVKFE